MSKPIIIRNGYVFDPINKINGEVMDIAIKDGKIVKLEEVNEKEAIIIDARGKVVMPGGVDLHSHIAGPKVNAGRLLRIEDHYMTNIPMVDEIKPQTGSVAPNTYKIGYGYALLGYTFVAEAASPPLETRHTHHELDSIPIVDKMTYILVDSNWIGLDYMVKGEFEKLKIYFAWLLYAVKGYTLKLVNPGVAVPWNYGRGLGMDIDDQIPDYGLTPREIITYCGKVAEELKLPHSIHIHANRLGIPGNYTTLIETLKTVHRYRIHDRYAMHVTHVQFNSYKGDSWINLESGGEEVAKEVNNNPYVTIDLGQVVFGKALTMTADAPFEFALYHLTMWKATFSHVEAEAAAGIVPYTYRKRNYVNTIQWAIGLEVALLVKDPWRVVLTTDHPNGAPFTKYPDVITWLVSKKAREETMKKVSQRALKKCALPAIDREYTLYEIAIITRAGPAKILGIDKFKGHLGVGADGDVAIYDLDIKNIDISKDYEKVKKAFSRAWYVIKGGEIVVKEGKVVRHIYGRTIYIKPRILEERKDLLNQVLEEIKTKFKDYYSVTLNNFIIRENELRKPYEIVV